MASGASPCSEFETIIGDMVEHVASENATVVVRTVIDESLGDDMMVTMVERRACSTP